MKLVFRYLKPYLRRMSFGCIIKALGTFAELLLPLILSHILGEVILRRRVADILFWGGAMLFFSAVAMIANICANRIAAKSARNFAEELRRDLFAKTLRLSAAQTDRFTIPSLESRITTDTYNVHAFVNIGQRLAIRAPIMLLGGIIITLFMDAYLALVMIVTMPVIFGAIYFISVKGIPLYTKVQKSVDSMIRVVREDAQGIRVIKALSKTDYEHRRYDKVNRRLVRDETKAGIIMGSINPLMALFMNIGIVAVIALSASRVAAGLSDPETVIAFMQYFTLISMAMMTMSRMGVMYTKNVASANRIAEVLDSPEDICVMEKSEYPDIQTDAHIVFDKVSFSYRGKKNNLDNISFSLKKGGSLGVIGATGSGKSTLVKLLMRFYDVDSGAIYLNGEDIRTMNKARFYAMFGSAMQQDFLYNDTIEENIRFGRDISKEQIVKAARIAQADDFITGFADGYSHELSTAGTNISGGQKQRILISRALAADPEILVLDDSSSALDYKTDAALRRALAENMGDTTVVTVAQRVSSVKNCDLIIVLEDGAVIGMGDHAHLLENCPEYREISESQMGGAFVE